MSDRDDVTRSMPADATAPFDPSATRTAEPPSPTGASVPPDLPLNYTLLGELGRGAMGVVYRARQVMLNREVALKLILAGRHASAQAVARFLAEVQAAAAVDHPNVVRVYDSGEHAGTPYLAMEYVGGGTLSAKLAGGLLPPREAAELLAKVCDGVNAAHATGIVHRDLKPGNILLTADGAPKVADFGLAKRPGGTDLTHTGAIFGTPGYMAPEQARGQGKGVGPPADVYALGAVLFACLAGRPPFVGDDPLEMVMKAATDDPPSLRGLVKGVPRDLDTIVAKCLRKDPAARYPNAGELAADLRRWLSGDPIHARRAGWAERGRRWLWRYRLAVGFVLAMASAAVGWRFLLFAPGTGSFPTIADDKLDAPELKPVVAARSVAEQFLKHAAENPVGVEAKKWTTPDFSYVYTVGRAKGRDRPRYFYVEPRLDNLPIEIDEGKRVMFTGTAKVLDRSLGEPISVGSGGRANFSLVLKKSVQGGWQVDEFEFEDRGCQVGPADLPFDVASKEILETLNYPPEAFKKNSLPELEEMLGMRSWLLYYTGGPVQFRLVLEETGQATIHPLNLLASERSPYINENQEGRVCLQIGRVLGKETLAPIDTVRMKLVRNWSSNHDLPCLWYHWKGVVLTENVETRKLADGKEHEVLTLTAEETEVEKGKEPRKVVLRVMAKKADKK